LSTGSEGLPIYAGLKPCPTASYLLPLQ